MPNPATCVVPAGTYYSIVSQSDADNTAYAAACACANLLLECGTTSSSTTTSHPCVPPGVEYLVECPSVPAGHKFLCCAPTEYPVLNVAGDCYECGTTTTTSTGPPPPTTTTCQPLGWVLTSIVPYNPKNCEVLGESNYGVTIGHIYHGSFTFSNITNYVSSGGAQCDHQVWDTGAVLPNSANIGDTYVVSSDSSGNASDTFIFTYLGNCTTTSSTSSVAPPPPTTTLPPVTSSTSSTPPPPPPTTTTTQTTTPCPGGIFGVQLLTAGIVPVSGLCASDNNGPLTFNSTPSVGYISISPWTTEFEFIAPGLGIHIFGTDDNSGVFSSAMAARCSGQNAVFGSTFSATGSDGCAYNIHLEYCGICVGTSGSCASDNQYLYNYCTHQLECTPAICPMNQSVCASMGGTWYDTGSSFICAVNCHYYNPCGSLHGMARIVTTSTTSTTTGIPDVGCTGAMYYNSGTGTYPACTPNPPDQHCNDLCVGLETGFTLIGDSTTISTNAMQVCFGIYASSGYFTHAGKTFYHEVSPFWIPGCATTEYHDVTRTA
jgi:hypothetical protein